MKASGTTPAVFLDRDGTIIEDRGHLKSPSEVVFFPGTIRGLRLLYRSFKLFIVTNQPGIAEGTIRPGELAAVHDFMLGRLARSGVRIERVYCCPHRHSDGCQCIKPRAYHLRQAARDFRIDLRKSFVIGDHPHDVELARRVGATGIYVLTGHGMRHRGELADGAMVTSGIWRAATLIMEMCGGTRRPRRGDGHGGHRRGGSGGRWP